MGEDASSKIAACQWLEEGVNSSVSGDLKATLDDLDWDERLALGSSTSEIIHLFHNLSTSSEETKSIALHQ